MYGTRVALILVFITYPGILLPIPSAGLWSWLRGLWQASWVTGLHAFSEGKYSFIAEAIYYAVFLLWALVQLSPYMKGL